MTRACVGSVLCTAALLLGCTRIAPAPKPVPKAVAKQPAVAPVPAPAASPPVVAPAVVEEPVIETPPPREEHTERMLVLVKPGGPLVVELTMTIDGKPFRQPRRELIDALFAEGQKAAGGTWSWEEAIDSRQLSFAAMNQQGRYQSELQQQQRIRLYDTSRDGAVDRSEIDRFVALADGSGSVFALDNIHAYEDLVNLFDVLDTDLDAKLSEAEWSAADTLLKSRDADDDDLIYPAEMTEAAASTMQGQMPASQTTYRAGPPAAVAIGLGLDTESLFYLLRELYLGMEGDLTPACFPLVPSLVTTLDKNSNQQLDRDELAGLNEVEPHLRLEANFGASGELPSGFKLRAISPELGREDEIVSQLASTLFVRLPFATVSFRLEDQTAGDEQIADAQFAQLDGDKNGYLEKKEIEGANPMLSAVFDSMDPDGDGKVYRDDLLAYSRRQQAPGLTRVAATAAKQEQAVFGALDLNNDGRLSRRELRTAAAFLGRLDRDGDQGVSRTEFPGQWTITLRRGGAAGPMNPAAMMTNYVAPTRSGPAWFQRTDSNGDGDVSLREFLGTAEQFAQLDSSGDGFIDAAEAEAVTPTAESPSTPAEAAL